MKTMRAMIVTCLLAAALAWGCGTQTKDGVVERESEPHVHKPGPHKGVIEDFGTDGKHHVEVVYDRQQKEVTVYVLGEDMETATPIKADKLTLQHEKPAEQVELKAKPLDGEKDGVSSRFVGKAEKLGDEGPVPPYEVIGVVGEGKKSKQHVAKYKKPKKGA